MGLLHLSIGVSINMVAAMVAVALGPSNEWMPYAVSFVVGGFAYVGHSSCFESDSHKSSARRLFGCISFSCALGPITAAWASKYLGTDPTSLNAIVPSSFVVGFGGPALATMVGPQILQMLQSAIVRKAKEVLPGDEKS